MFLDYEKAFDCIDWNFIYNTLLYFDFGPSLIQWIQVFYNNAVTCVMNNGFVSSCFKVSRGVRQGCPLSPYLFICCTEILNALIVYNQNIKGIFVDNFEVKISQYADDTVLICDGTDNSISEIRKVLNNFSNVSGLKVNFEKSFIFLLGPYVTSTPNRFSNYEYPICKNSFTYLGITFSHHYEDFFQLNYVPKLSRIKSILKIWETRDLTPIGKIQILKSFAISQIVYLLMVLPNPHSNFFAELNSVFFQFIWGNKPDKVARSVMFNDMCDGGLDMINMFIFAKSLKCKWVKMYLDNIVNPCKSLLDYFLKWLWW